MQHRTLLAISCSAALAGQGCKAMHESARAEDSPRNRATVEADPSQLNEYRDGATMLLEAAHGEDLEMVTFLLDAGADPDLASPRGVTPLMWATVRGNESIVAALLARDADPNLAEGGTAFDYTPLYIAARDGRDEIAAILLDAGAEPQGTLAIHQSAGRGNAFLVDRMLQTGEDPDAQTPAGETALGLAARNGHVSTVRLLLDKGADPNHSSDDGGTPLHAAAFDGHVSIVELPLDSGADPNARSESGWRPIHAAAYSGHAEVVLLLVQRGATPELVPARDPAPYRIDEDPGDGEPEAYLNAAAADAFSNAMLLSATSGSAQMMCSEARQAERLLAASAERDPQTEPRSTRTIQLERTRELLRSDCPG